MFIFSKELIEDTIRCFKEEDGLDLPPELVNEYLMAYANLYLAFVKKEVLKRFDVHALACPEDPEKSALLEVPKET